MIVVDASVVVTALADDGPDGDRVRRRLLGEQLVAPDLIDLEVISAWRRLVAAEALPLRRARLALDDLARLPMPRAPHLGLVDRCWELRDNVTPYDAAYIALAEAFDTTLLTGDARLAGAPGPRCRIEVI